MIEDQFAIALLSVLFMALRIHALSDRDDLPIARLVHMGIRLRRFVAWEELRATLRRKFPTKRDVHDPTLCRCCNPALRYQGEYLQRIEPRFTRTVPMPERPDRRLM